MALIAWTISSPEFLAASALCAARLPTCVATTAKPLPSSPALAASIEALSARRLVLEAISLIVLIMLLTCLEFSLIVSIAFTISCICVLLSTISSPTFLAISLAVLALWAFIFTWSDTLAIVLCNSWTELAWSVAPSVIDCAPSESWLALDATISATLFISESVFDKSLITLTSEASISLKSPTCSTSGAILKLPSAISLRPLDISLIISLSLSDISVNLLESCPISSLYSDCGLAEKSPMASLSATSTTPLIGFIYFLTRRELMITIIASVAIAIITISATSIIVLLKRSVLFSALAAHHVCPAALIGE